jgi:simple sugar transport system permease protein
MVTDDPRVLHERGYQLVFLFGIGTVIPLNNKAMVLPQVSGCEHRDLVTVKYPWIGCCHHTGVAVIPLATFIVIGFWLGRCCGSSARSSGRTCEPWGRICASPRFRHQVDRVRRLAVLTSTVLASIGHIIFLQNIGTINTYDSHGQIGTFAIAAMLVGGATVSKATSAKLAGTFLFHLLFMCRLTPARTSWEAPRW